jgi:hypothetical protein
MGIKGRGQSGVDVRGEPGTPWLKSYHRICGGQSPEKYRMRVKGGTSAVSWRGAGGA